MREPKIASFLSKVRSLVLGFCCFSSPFSGEERGEFLFKKPPFASCHASTIAESASGKLLCAYFAGSREGAKDVGIWLSIKGEGGWSAPRLIAKEQKVPCWNPVLYTAPSGEILLFYKVGSTPSSWSGVLRRSWDEGEHWSEEELLPAGILGPVKNKPLLLSDGTLLCGSSIETWRRWGCWIDITRDGGKSWEKSGPINLKENLFGIIQPTLFWGEEGKLRLLARSHRAKRICSAVSEDKGWSWSEAQPTDLPNPNSAIDAVALREGPILLVYNHSETKRSPLNLALSYDGGVHWEPSWVLENGRGEYSYPSVIQGKDGKIHITYTYDRTHIKYVAIDPAELLKGGASPQLP